MARQTHAPVRTHIKLVIAAGIAAAVIGSFVSGVRSQQLVADAQGTQCDQIYQQCISNKTSPTTCRNQWNSCVTAKCPTTATQCSKIPECQTYCTESATSQGGILSCCKGGPKIGPNMPNPCKDEVDGKCNPKKPDGMMMGMLPMLPMIPMMMPKMDMPMMPPLGGGFPTDPCGLGFEREAGSATSSNGCGQGGSSVSSWLLNLFNTPSTSNGTSTATTSRPISVLIRWLTGLTATSSGQATATADVQQPATPFNVVTVQMIGQGSVQPGAYTSTTTAYTGAWRPQPAVSTFSSTNLNGQSTAEPQQGGVAGVLANLARMLSEALRWLTGR